MFDLAQHTAACEDWVAHPQHCPDDVIRAGGKCIGFTRRSWHLDSLGASALDAYRNTPKAEIHNSDPEDVPDGAICYGLHGDFGQPLYKFAHAWVATVNLGCYTTDYGGMGRLWKEPMALTRWTGVKKVTWTSWTPQGRLPVGRPHRAIVKASRSLSAHQLHVIRLVNTHQASAHQQHVVHVWRLTGVWSE